MPGKQPAYARSRQGDGQAHEVVYGQHTHVGGHFVRAQPHENGDEGAAGYGQQKVDHDGTPLFVFLPSLYAISP